MISEETSQKIKNMSIVCAMLVVTIHMQWSHSAFSCNWLVMHLVQRGIALIAVPFFFVVSGFLLSRHMHDPDWHETEIKKRIYSLLVPFVIWVAISIIINVPLLMITDVLAHRPLGYTLNLTTNGWLEICGFDLRNGPFYVTSLWYVRCLFCFVLLAPVFKWLVSKGRIVWLLCAFALTFSHASWALLPASMQSFFQHGFSLSGMFYFSVGISIGLFGGVKLSKAWFVSCMVVSMGILATKTLLAYFEINPRVNLMTIAIPFALYAVWYITPKSKWTSLLTSCAFPIFLMHQPISLYIQLARKHSPFSGDGWCFLQFLGMLLASVSIAIILRRFFPRINAFLFAGRS